VDQSLTVGQAIAIARNRRVGSCGTSNRQPGRLASGERHNPERLASIRREEKIIFFPSAVQVSPFTNALSNVSW
jgi:hypothetical protein